MAYSSPPATSAMNSTLPSALRATACSEVFRDVPRRAVCVVESSSRGAKRRGDPGNLGRSTAPGLLRFARNDDRGSSQVQVCLRRLRRPSHEEGRAPPIERRRSPPAIVAATSQQTLTPGSELEHSARPKIALSKRAMCGIRLARPLQQFVNGNVTIMHTCHKLYLGCERLLK